MNVTWLASDPPSIRATVLADTISCLRLARFCCPTAAPQLNKRSTLKPTQGQNGRRIGWTLCTGAHFDQCWVFHAALSFAPLGMTPCSTKCHSAISSRLASATIPMRRDRAPVRPKRSRYHFDSALPGWWRSHDQASSTMSVRTRALPALLMPWSCSREPDRYGLEPKPTLPASSRRLLNVRQPKSSRTSNQGQHCPHPRSCCSRRCLAKLGS